VYPELIRSASRILRSYQGDPDSYVDGNFK